jgi:Flp pilus assembly protein TadG
MLGRLRKWMLDDDATAAIEAGLLFPVLVLVLCGMVDAGMAITLNQRATDATQMISDLLTRNPTVSDADINDAIEAGKMAIMPYDTASYGVDIMGIQYIGTELTPTVQWHPTPYNMDENAEMPDHAAGLGNQDEGVVGVTVQYIFKPYFSYYFVGQITMKEESYARGRKGKFVTKS